MLKSTILFVLSVSLDFLHEITLLAVGIDKIGCLEPFLLLHHSVICRCMAQPAGYEPARGDPIGF